MSYGLVGDGVDTFGPTTQGMRLLREAVETSSGYPTLKMFVVNGATDNPQQLAIECNQFAKIVAGDVKSTVLNLAHAALQCKKELQLC